jgi:hypothetical protein
MQKTFPTDGKGGDLLVLMDDLRQCTLWFCVDDRTTNPDGSTILGALWAQVLLGPSFDGRG